MKKWQGSSRNGSTCRRYNRQDLTAIATFCELLKVKKCILYQIVGSCQFGNTDVLKCIYYKFWAHLSLTVGFVCYIMICCE